MEPRTRERIEKRTLPLIRSGFPDALVTGFDPARVIGTTDTNDRHVASAGATIAPCVLVTNNLKDFDIRVLKALAVQVQTPDQFRAELFASKPEIVEAATREAAANLTKTNPTWEEYLNLLATRCGLPKFVPAFNCQDPAMSRVKPRRLRRSNESRDVLLRCSLSPLLHPALIATLTKVRP